MLLAAGLPSGICHAAQAQGLAARDVVQLLFSARDGVRPNFANADLAGLDLADIDFKHANLSNANLFGTDLTNANLEGSNLSNAILDRATLVKTRFNGSSLQGASIRRPSVYADMTLNSADLPVFRDADLTRARVTARLGGADFAGANLTEASFVVWEERNLGGPPVSGLERCDFSGARLIGANLWGVSLIRSVFRNADLSRADLRNADLSHADFEGAIIAGANLEGAILLDTKGLHIP